MRWLRETWQRLAEPSLLRRLLLAQLALLSVVWVALVGGLIWLSQSEDSVRSTVPALEATVSAVQALGDQPEVLQEVLSKIDVWNRFGDGEEDDPALRTGTVVWVAGERRFATEGLPDEALVRRPPGFYRFQSGGTNWLMLTEQRLANARGHPEATVSFIYSDAAMAALRAFSTSHVALLPLLVSMPLLVLPAWLSVRMALRPWRRLSAEVARRDAQDLSPVSTPTRQRELRPLVDALNRLLGEVREARERERRFVADAAHELRTPLAALQLYAQSLQPLIRAGSGERELAGMLRTSERSVRLVNQLLALMRSETQVEVASQPVELGALAQGVLAEAAALASQRRVVLDLEAEPGLWLDGEPDGLNSLFTNLVDNAIKYSPESGLVRLRLWRERGELHAELCDQGPGIAPQWRDAVLQRFTRVPDQAQSGSGLGLAIVATVLARHRGRLALDDAPGGGLRVQLIFPAAPRPA
ncbi:HAMP domain-containing histidine kinase [Pelomonas sp. CA6]|uniref:sensor histidine kinase n=1 Tax=Pelomonas sp. CA6 TaxID=2907999 RepID=UPI001F4BD301|nr:HAMP domain-containing sensor histidine kinase [Pelomonas sp. CA6]MCH7343964.1 HAMP domain-containing histidine kinase [Pelomonas sp. CA6]